MGRVAEKVSATELVEHAQEDRAEVLGRLGLVEGPASELRQLLEERVGLAFADGNAVGDDLGAAGRLEDRRRREPAHGLETVTEENQQGAPDVRLAEHDAGEGGVHERGVPSALRPVERLSQPLALA